MALFDLALGLWVYVIVTWLTYHRWSWIGLGIAVTAAVLPDGDFVLLAALKKSRKPLDRLGFTRLVDGISGFVGHQQVGHYPLVYALALVLVYWYLSHRGVVIESYFVLLAALGLTAHFLEDGIASPGDQYPGVSLWPLSLKLILLRTRLAKVDELDYAARNVRMESQTFWQIMKEQVWNRAFAMTPFQGLIVYMAVLFTIAFYVAWR